MPASAPFAWIEPASDVAGESAPFAWIEPHAIGPGLSAPFAFDNPGEIFVGSRARVKQLDIDAPLQLWATTAAGLPPAHGLFGQVAYVTDAPGGAVPVFSDNSQWLSWADRSVIA